MKKAIFLDRDGVIVKDNGYIDKIEEVEFFPYTFESLKKLDKEYELFIVTNQSGIGKGLSRADGVAQVNNYIVDEIKKAGIHIHELFCCPHKTEDNCQCKKPKPYFILKAKEQYNIDIDNSYVIGDHVSDIAFAVNAGATGIFVLTGHGYKHIDDLKESKLTNLVFDSLKEAVDWILTNSNN